MDNRKILSGRKADHIRINLEHDVASGLKTGLDAYLFRHQALPEINLSDVETDVVFLDKQLDAPILISSMTGGTEEAFTINRNLAQAAQTFGFAMGVGSQRAALENELLSYSFKIRDIAPDILLFANLGAIQLNKGYDIDVCQKAVDMIQADGLILHLNPLQEALQPEGDTNFRGLLEKIEHICRKLPVPVLVKEVGWGISGQTARMLCDAGVAAIDVAGAGGTSWSQVEMHRMNDPYQAGVAEVFRDWGIPTAESILAVRHEIPDMPVIASGGLRNGVDAAKCLALGANVCGFAGLFLKAAASSYDDLEKTARMVIQQLRVSMFAAGVGRIEQLEIGLLEKRQG